jgi:hypothetical protein
MKTIILLCAIALMLTTAVIAAPPQICRVQGGNVRTIWGVGFMPKQTEIWGWSAPYDELKAKAALTSGNFGPAVPMPSKPPKGSTKVNIIDTDPRGQIVTVDFNQNYNGESLFDAMLGPDMIWARNGDGYSKVWRVKAAQVWFVYPEKANPGQRIRIIGRNINAKLVAINPKSGQPIFLGGVQPGRMAMYEASALLPANVKPGKYQLYVHNGTCGDVGWSEPIDLTIQPKPKPVTNILNVRDFGAKGDSTADDTAAIKLALAKAAKLAPAIVYFPPGRYPIHQTLLIRSGVTLKGSGMYNSTICVSPERPLRFDIPVGAVKLNSWFTERMAKTKAAPMLWMSSNTQLMDLGFTDGPGVQQVAYVGHDNCHIIRCRMYMPSAPFSAVCVEWGSYGFVMKDCEVEALRGCLYVRHGPHEQLYIGGNKFRATSPGLIDTNNLFVRAFDRSIIENNTSRDADRNFIEQVGHASAYHSILQGNSWFNNIPRRHNSGENMYESGSSQWHGNVVRATANTLTVAGTPFAVTPAKIATWQTAYETFVLIIDGRGLGQYRKVVSFTPNTLTLEKPWDVVPDSSTYVTVGRASVETLWVDNTEEHTANWTAWWGNCWGNVIDGQILRDGEGIYLWAFDNEKPSPVAFNDIIGSYLTGRAQIKFIGPLVFGNTVRATEITNFRYLPSFHGSVPWMISQPTRWNSAFDPTSRFGIDFGPSDHKMPTLPSTAPLKDWNIIEAVNIYDGPKGIHIAPDANHNVLKHILINVDGEKIVDESKTTVGNGN